MPNILLYAANTYTKNIKLILLFSLAFVLAFLIPIFAAFPTYNDLGAIMLRTSSIFLNLNLLNTAVIVIAVFFSLLFLSFAIVAINVICKHSRTHTKIGHYVLEGFEAYTSKVFIVLLFETLILLVVGVAFYSTGYSAVATAIASLVIAPAFFYAPASIVVDDTRVVHSMRASVRFFARKLGYFVLWVVVAVLLLSVFDCLFILTGGTLVSRYAMLVFSSLFILPFLVVLQTECYINRFKLLKH
jgi:hypothetical protein